MAITDPVDLNDGGESDDGLSGEAALDAALDAVESAEEAVRFEELEKEYEAEEAGKSPDDDDGEPDGSEDDGEGVEMPAGQVFARENGWTDKEEWVESGKDPDEWFDWPEFNRRKPLFDKIQQQSDELKNLRRAVKLEIKKLVDANRKSSLDTVVHEVKSAEAALRAKYNQLKAEGDSLGALEVRDQLDELLANSAQRVRELQELNATEEKSFLDSEEEDKEPKLDIKLAQSIQPAMDAFTKANPWYGKDPGLTQYAEAYSASLMRNVPNDKRTPELFVKILNDTAKEVRTKFATHAAFKPSVVRKSPIKAGGESNAAVSSGAGRKGFKDLPPEAKRAALEFRDSKIMTVQEYVNDYFNQKPLKQKGKK